MRAHARSRTQVPVSTLYVQGRSHARSSSSDWESGRPQGTQRISADLSGSQRISVDLSGSQRISAWSRGARAPIERAHGPGFIAHRAARRTLTACALIYGKPRGTNRARAKTEASCVGRCDENGRPETSPRPESAASRTGGAGGGRIAASDEPRCPLTRTSLAVAHTRPVGRLPVVHQRALTRIYNVHKSEVAPRASSGHEYNALYTVTELYYIRPPPWPSDRASAAAAHTRTSEVTSLKCTSWYTCTGVSDQSR